MQMLVKLLKCLFPFCHPGQAAVWQGTEEEGAEKAERGGHLDAPWSQREAAADRRRKMEHLYSCRQCL